MPHPLPHDAPLLRQPKRIDKLNSDHTLFLGDCLASMQTLQSGQADLILTDPPYNLGNFMIGRATGIQRMRKNFFATAGWDNLEESAWAESMENFFHESSRVIKPGGTMIVFMALIKVETVIKIAEKHGFYYKTTGIWHKLNPMPRNMNLHFVNSTEAWLYFVHKTRTGTFENEGKLVHDFIETPVTPTSERKYGKHPTQKPLALMEHFVSLLSRPNETVLDPFMGSGSSGVASRRLGRNFIGVELDENYFEIAKKRIAEAEQWRLM